MKKNTDKKVWHTAHANSEEEFIVSNIMKNISNIKVSVKKSTWLLYAYI